VDVGAMNERIAQAEQLLEHFGHEIVHCRQVRDLVLNLFDQLQELHRLGTDEREILNAATLVRELRCEIGERHVIIHVKALTETGLHIEGASRKRELFETVFGRPVDFSILSP